MGIFYKKSDIPDHLQKYFVPAEIGLEQRVPEYINQLVEVFALVDQLLSDDGVLFVNIGDTYAGFKDGKFIAQSNAKGNPRGLPVSNAPHRCRALLEMDGFRHKELMGIPWRFALAGSRVGDVVFDPFMGSGTTAAVAVKHGRKYLGCELNEDYQALQDKRIQSEVCHG